MGIRSLVTLAGAVAAVLLTGLLVTQVFAGAAGDGCRVDYTVSSRSEAGFSAAVKITNVGEPVLGWRLVWTYPAGVRVTRASDATVTQVGGRVTAANGAGNASVPTNGAVTFGVTGSRTGGPAEGADPGDAGTAATTNRDTDAGTTNAGTMNDGTTNRTTNDGTANDDGTTDAGTTNDDGTDAVPARFELNGFTCNLVIQPTAGGGLAGDVSG